MSKQQDHRPDILEPFVIARKLEEEGKQFFEEAAANTRSRLARQTFEFLAAEEDRHLEKINQFYQSVAESDGADVPDIEASDAEHRLEAFNERLAQLKDELKPTVTDTEAYRLALKFENGAEDFYEEKMKEAQDPRLKKFYAWLIEEEKMHGRLLKSCLKFAEDPAEWFRQRR